MGVFYKEPKCKKCRRLRVKLFLKGSRCHTAKCAIERRNYPPGIRSMRPPKISEYGRRLQEKQKLRFFYGLGEKSMQINFKTANKQKGITGDNLLSLFERRIDNIAFRLHVSKSRSHARQMVKHGLILINGKKLTIPSAILGVGDTLTLFERSEDKFKLIDDQVTEKQIPNWITYDKKKCEFTVIQHPTREENDVPVEDRLIVEYYSK